MSVNSYMYRTGRALWDKTGLLRVTIDLVSLSVQSVGCWICSCVWFRTLLIKCVFSLVGTLGLPSVGKDQVSLSVCSIDCFICSCLWLWALLMVCVLIVSLWQGIFCFRPYHYVLTVRAWWSYLFCWALKLHEVLNITLSDESWVLWLDMHAFITFVRSYDASIHRRMRFLGLNVFISSHVGRNPGVF